MKRKWFAWVLTALLLLVSLPLAALAAPASFDPGTFGHSLRSEHFTIYYNTSGNGAIAPEQGQAVADAMELAYRRLITEGGLRPLRMLPEPVVAGVDRRELGGTNTSEAMAYRQWIFINVAQGDWATLYATCAHELFHSIQWNYLANGFDTGDDWVIEGTAPAAAYLAFADDPATAASLLDNHMDEYWRSHGEPLKSQAYAPSLFWYSVASRYGGLPFLDRFFQLADALGWERGLQLAVLEAGGPDDTTFDTLFRDFMLTLPTGGIPLPYPPGAGRWAADGWLSFAGDPVRLSRAPVLAGLADSGAAFAAYPPLRVPTWAFHGFTLSTAGAGSRLPLRVRLSGDPNLELYALVQGEDGTWRGLRAAFPGGGLVLPPVGAGQTVTLLVARLGTVGNGRYAISIDSAAATATAALQPLTALSLDPPGGPRDGMPAALTADELRALRAGQMPLTDTGIAEATVSVALRPGTTAYGTGGGSKTLPAAPRFVTGKGPGLFLAAPLEIAFDLGATATVRADQATVSYQGTLYSLTAGSTAVRASDGMRWELPAAPVLAGTTLLVPLDFWQGLHFAVTTGRGPGTQTVFVIASPVSQ